MGENAFLQKKEGKSTRKKVGIGMKPCAQNSSTQEAEAGGEAEFEASLGDIARPYFKQPT